MSRRVHIIAGMLLGLTLAVIGFEGPAQAAVDREKLLSDPGVYGTFAVFKVDEDWWKLDQAARASAAAEAKAVFQKHGEHLTTDTYLLRGLTDRADFFIRVHSTELLHTQNFLVELMGTGLGKHLANTATFNGLTKKPNYVPGFSDELKTTLKTPPDPGPKPYVIVVPIRKDAAWWQTSQEERSAMMKEHTEASLAYLNTVKRKLYHSTGLDDLDFITYFETAKLDDFNNLIIALARVKENRHNKQFGHPTLLGTIRPLDEILDILSR
ncbi:MAG: chlorite dismutase family protein [Nitrospiraceae bacterium]